MATFMVFGFFLAAIIVVRAIILVAAFGRLTARLRIFYFAIFVNAAIASYYSTFHYVYFMNPNTEIHGWPLPIVVFQRSAPDAPWRDFVGPTTLYVLPMNLILFAIVPSVAAIVFVKKRNKLLIAPAEKVAA